MIIITKTIEKKAIDLKIIFFDKIEFGGFLIEIKTIMIVQNKNKINQPITKEYRKSIIMYSCFKPYKGILYYK